MKKIPIAFLLLLLVPLLAAGEERFFLSAGAAAVVPADANFADLYGNAQVSPELRFGYNVLRHFHFWLGGAFFAAKGTIPIVEDEARASQSFLSLGAGWETRRGRRLQGEATIALLLAGFREKAMGATVSKTAFGFDVGLGLRYFLKKKVFLEAAVGYAGAWTAARTEVGETDIILGGVRLGGRLGFRF
ncbi:MAG: hypothetical protein JXO51_05230 [Candidatus Aminicenantes bacterium]|nr:hypothetical protein [Candidatus Aminicenantes bacterium]